REKEEKHKRGLEARKKAVLNSVFFVIGFSAVFISLGASATTIGRLITEYKRPLSIIAGIVIIVLGLHMTSIIKIPVLYSEKRLQVSSKPLNVFGAFIVGLAFAFGWTPCIGPILAGILAVAAAQETLGRGMALLSFYSLGLGIPFILTAFSISLFFSFFNKIKRSINIIELIAGGLLIVIGLLMITGWLTTIASWFGFMYNFAK
ncbi:MAG TPA: cytochrome c biogenesis protein CcdA, partial [Candidatus Goldiibacteriota bacterium]|nr:cytochrome c biogenesis protein CcdA [Candidatus Goldiibacteriota bacterium]